MNNRPPEPCPPRSDCWCERHPNNPNCPKGMPLNNGDGIILILILTIIWKRKYLLRLWS